MEPGRDNISPYLKNNLKNKTQENSLCLPDTLGMLDHLAQHFIVNKYLAVNIQLVILQEATLLWVGFPHLHQGGCYVAGLF